jgi:hypothetical protein
MNDKQVVELYYRLESIKAVDFKSPPPIEGETTSFCYFLDNGKLTIKLKPPCSSVEDAQNLVDNFLRSWEMDDAIRNGRCRFKFKLYDAKIIDPNNPNATIIYTQGINLKLGVSGEIKFIEPLYPDPPNIFKITPDVLTLWQRYEGYLENHEPLQSMGYFCFSLLKFRAGSPKKAEKLYLIHFKVLKKLSELTSTKGDEKTARKIDHGSSFDPLSAIEIEWIQATTKTIIRRVGEIDAAPSLPVITMNDLPKLP